MSSVSAAQGPFAPANAPAAGLHREPSKEDIELAQQLVNHAQGIQYAQRDQQGRDLPPQREPSISSNSREHALPSQFSNQQDVPPDAVAGNELASDGQMVNGRRSLGAPAGGQMCRSV